MYIWVSFIFSYMNHLIKKRKKKKKRDFTSNCFLSISIQNQNCASSIYDSSTYARPFLRRKILVEATRTKNLSRFHMFDFLIRNIDKLIFASSGGLHDIIINQRLVA